MFDVFDVFDVFDMFDVFDVFDDLALAGNSATAGCTAVPGRVGVLCV